MDLNFIQNNIVGILGIIITVVLGCIGAIKILKIKSNKQTVGDIKGGGNIINQASRDIDNSKR